MVKLTESQIIRAYRDANDFAHTVDHSSEKYGLSRRFSLENCERIFLDYYKSLDINKKAHNLIVGLSVGSMLYGFGNFLYNSTANQRYIQSLNLAQEQHLVEENPEYSSSLEISALAIKLGVIFGLATLVSRPILKQAIKSETKRKLEYLVSGKLPDELSPRIPEGF